MSVMMRIACAGRIDVGAARDVFLQHIVLHRAGELANVAAGAPRGDDVERQQNGRGGVDGHRGGDLAPG